MVRSSQVEIKVRQVRLDYQTRGTTVNQPSVTFHSLFQVPLRNLRSLKLAGNPLTCNCSLVWFSRLASNPNSSIIFDQPTCASPPALYGEYRYLCSQVRIQKRYALSPRLFSKATEMISGVFKSASPVKDVEILSLCLQKSKETLKTHENLDKSF